MLEITSMKGSVWNQPAISEVVNKQSEPAWFLQSSSEICILWFTTLPCPPQRCNSDAVSCLLMWSAGKLLAYGFAGMNGDNSVGSWVEPRPAFTSYPFSIFRLVYSFWGGATNCRWGLFCSKHLTVWWRVPRLSPDAIFLLVCFVDFICM